MKKQLKKVVALGLGVVLIAFCMGFTQQMSGEELDFQREMQSQGKALEACEKLYASFSKDAENGIPIFPDVYGGEYIDGDKLVVQLTQNTPENQAKYLALCGNSDKVVFQEVPYSLNFLQGLDTQAENYAARYDVIGYGPRRTNNEYVIQVAKEDLPKVQQEVQRQRSSLPIRFEEGEHPKTSATPLRGGDLITSANARYGSSVGIGGRYKGQPAVITHGHGFSTNVSLSYNGTKVGSIKLCQYTNQGYGDYAIATIDNTSLFTATQLVRYSSGTVGISSTYSSAPEGTSIYKYGAKAGYAYGSITSVMQSVSYDADFYIRGITYSSVRNTAGTQSVMEGDSGGPVYLFSGSSYKLCGTVSGYRDGNTTPWRLMYHSPIGHAEIAGFSLS